MTPEKNGMSRAQKILNVVLLIFGIAGAMYGFGNFLFYSQAEGDSMKAEFKAHTDWGSEKYKEVIGRLDKLDVKMDSLISYRQQVLFELRDLRRDLRGGR